MTVLILDELYFLICHCHEFNKSLNIAILGKNYCAYEIFDSKSLRCFSGLGKPAKTNQRWASFDSYLWRIEWTDYSLDILSEIPIDSKEDLYVKQWN